MTCEECRELLARLVESPLDGVDVRAHLATCAGCRAEVESVRVLHARLQRAGAAQVGGGVMEGVMGEVERVANAKQRRKVMWKRMNLGMSAAAAVLAVVLWLVWGQGGAVARAADVLKEGAAAAREASCLHIVAQMRSRPADTPSSLELNAGMTKVEIWAEKREGQVARWRVEKKGRIMMADGKATYMYVPMAEMAVTLPAMTPGESGDMRWMKDLLDPEALLAQEGENAVKKEGDYKVSEEDVNGRKVRVVTAEIKAEGNEGTDWLKNKTVMTSDTRRVYRFDAATHRLEGFQLTVHAGPGKDVLAFETTAIEYPKEIAEKVFVIELPKGVAWEDFMARQMGVTPVPAACAPEKKPEEVARAFFESLSKGDKEAFEGYWTVKIKYPAGALEQFKGLKVVSIGVPEEPRVNQGVWFVPYKVELKNGEVKEFKLNVRCDNPVGRWFVDGGF